jgi:hypothetical protein
VVDSFHYICDRDGCFGEGAITDWVDLYTEKREAKFTSLIQAFDLASTIRSAEPIRSNGLAKPIFKYVDPHILKKKEELTRKPCWDETKIVGVRCWVYVCHNTARGSTAKREIEQHLERYGDIKHLVMDHLAEKVMLGALDEKLTVENKKLI